MWSCLAVSHLKEVVPRDQAAEQTRSFLQGAAYCLTRGGGRLKTPETCHFLPSPAICDVGVLHTADSDVRFGTSVSV